MIERNEENKSGKPPKIPALPVLSRSVKFLLTLVFVNLVVMVAGIATSVTIYAFSYCLIMAGLSMTFRIMWNDFAKRQNEKDSNRPPR